MAKRIILAVLLVAVLLMSVLTGCSQSAPATQEQPAQQNTNTAPQTTPTNNQAANSNAVPQPPALPTE